MTTHRFEKVENNAVGKNGKTICTVQRGGERVSLSDAQIGTGWGESQRASERERDGERGMDREREGGMERERERDGWMEREREGERERGRERGR